MAIAIGHVIAGSMIAAPLFVTPSPAIAQQLVQARSYSIPASSLEDALTRFGREAGIMLSFNGETTAGLQSQGLHGSYTAELGLDALLAGSGLRAVRQTNGSYTLDALPKNEAALPLVTVSGKAPGSMTEGTGSYTTGSSSSSTRLNLAPNETPQSLTVLTRQRIEDLNAKTIIEAMDAVPGITVAKTGAGDDSYGFYSRGFDVANYEVDGVPTDAGLNLFNQNLVIYDRVEVVRGATGLISGLGNPAATINLIRKRPTAAPQTSVNAQFGNWNRRGVGLDISRSLNESGSVRGRLVADYRQQEGWLDRFKEKSGTLYGIVEADLPNGTLLTAGFMHQTNNVDSPVRTGQPTRFADGGLANLPRTASYAPSWSYNDQKTNGVFASLEHDLGNGWTGKAEYSYTRSEYDFMFAYSRGTLQRDGSGTTILPVRWAGNPEQHNLDLYLTGAFSLFGREHELIAGATISRYETSGPNYGGYLTAYASSPAGVVPNLFANDGNHPTPTFTATGSGSTKTSTNAAYVSSRFHVSDDLKVILGTRVVQWDRNIRSWPFSGAATQTLSDENVIVPYLGVVYDLNKQWAVYGSATKIFNPQGSWVKDVNNNPLDPLEGRGYEIGVKGNHFGGKLNSSLAIFETSQDNLAVWANGSYTAEQNTNSKGYELEVSGEVMPGWQIAAGYTHVETKDVMDKRINTFLPRDSLKLHTSYRLQGALNGLTVGGGLRWQGDTEGGSIRQSAYTVASLMARYEIDRHLSLSAHIDNIFDRQYFSYPADYSLYGAQRSMVMRMNYKF